MTEEYLDILDEKGELTGESRSHREAHATGLIHRGVHVWLVNSHKQILLQKRAANKRAYPNYWDISASGHVSAGQTSLQGAQMETREELGLTFPDEVFIFLWALEEHIVLNEGTYVNNEFQDVYVVHMDVDISNIHSDEEVSEVQWVDMEQFKHLITVDGYLVPHAEEYARLIEYVERI